MVVETICGSIRLNIIVVSFAVVHMTKNFMAHLLNVRVPLILGQYTLSCVSIMSIMKKQVTIDIGLNA